MDADAWKRQWEMATSGNIKILHGIWRFPVFDICGSVDCPKDPPPRKEWYAALATMLREMADCATRISEES